MNTRVGGDNSRGQRVRIWLLVCAIHVVLTCSGLTESTFESRYQFYQEEHDRIRVDSNYSLFSIDLSDTVVLDGSLLYSAISGASPTGLTPLVRGDPVPIVELTDERYAFTLGLAKQFPNHLVKIGYAYSNESDYLSNAYSLQDTISFNQKNTELVLGFAFTDDIVSANGSSFSAPKRSYDALIGLNQVLGPDDLLSFNITLGWRQGFLSDPYKRVIINEFFVLPDTRPNHRFEQLLFLQWTHYILALDGSVETSYRFGHNDYGSHSHTAQIAFYKALFNKRLIVRPQFRYYRQSAADFYNTEFIGSPKFYSSDYRVSAEETFSLGFDVRWFLTRDRLALDVGYERYLTRGLDHKTSQTAYPDANALTVGLHLQF